VFVTVILWVLVTEPPEVSADASAAVLGAFATCRSRQFTVVDVADVLLPGFVSPGAVIVAEFTNGAHALAPLAVPVSVIVSDPGAAIDPPEHVTTWPTELQVPFQVPPWEVCVNPAGRLSTTVIPLAVPLPVAVTVSV